MNEINKTILNALNNSLVLMGRDPVEGPEEDEEDIEGAAV